MRGDDGIGATPTIVPRGNVLFPFHELPGGDESRAMKWYRIPRCVMVVGVTTACGGPVSVATVAEEPKGVRDSSAPTATMHPESVDSGVSEPLEPVEAEPPCPSDMVHIEHDFCPDVDRKCLVTEYNKPNRLTLCHHFEPGSTRCKTERVPLSFCIDKYEYPNRQGGHPPWMVSWYDAQATCRSLGKRTCWDWEWVAACEGPDETPFPYGWKRDNTMCNIDNLWIEPRLSAAYSNDRDVALRELSRLDQSVPSGSMPGCVSGYGVYDLTGNFDEWVTRAERDGHKSRWAGLKGGAWGHVRNACRPMTTSHPPEFTYYFIAFRCCKEPNGASAFVPPGSSLPPEVAPQDKAPIPVPIHPPGPSQRKVEPQRSRR